MQVSDFHYELPEELIAQEPLAERAASRMLVVSREDKSFRDDLFANFPRYVRPGDCLVLNNTRVFPARLHGRRNTESGAHIEVFLVRALNSDENEWLALVRPAKRVHAGEKILFGNDVAGEVISIGEFGERTIRFRSKEPMATAAALRAVPPRPARRSRAAPPPGGCASAGCPAIAAVAPAG